MGLSKKKIIIAVPIILITLLVLLGVGIVYGEAMNRLKSVPYEANYTGKVGVDGFFKDIVKKIGEPNKMSTDSNGLPLAIYNDFELHLMGKTVDDSGVAVVGITSSKYKFGKYDITVGSSKINVVKAYTSAGKYTNIGCQGDPKIYHAYDKGYILTFYFDDNDNVSKIEFYWQGDYETGVE
jgi:hypothetical protein